MENFHIESVGKKYREKQETRIYVQYCIVYL